MELKTCPNCKSPYLADQPNCPRCGAEHSWNQESYLNVGCLLLMLLLAALFVLLPFLMFAGMLIR